VSERDAVAEELRRVRDEVRARAEGGAAALPGARPTATAGAMAPLEEPAAEPAPARPDNAALNATWAVGRALEGGGARGAVARALGRLLARVLGAQEAFNSHQVRFDNALMEYIDARLAQTHRHYDRVLGLHHRHMEEIDTRHLILQEELVAHVHDLVRRIDLVLAESEKGRSSLEHGLRDVRQRLARLEERLAAR
jgi:hypothetical protein